MRRLPLALLALALVPARPAGATCAAPDDVAALRALVDAQCECATALDRKTYISCARAVVKAAVDDGRLLPACRGDVLACVAKSTCGKPGAVACCRRSATGKVRCSIKSSVDSCKPPRGGTACVSMASSCCGACEADGSCPFPTTSTSTTSTTSSTSSTAPPGPVCGNAVREPGEACDCGTDGCQDGDDLGGVTCPGGSVGGAFLNCVDDCTRVDTSGCPAVATTSTTVPTPTSTTHPPTTTSSSTTSSTATTSTVTTSTIPVLPCDDPILHLPPLLNIPLQLIPGSSSCGGPGLSPDATSPASGTVFDGSNHSLGDLGTNCLYVGGGNTVLPPIEIPDGGELIASVRGLRGSRAIIGASNGTGPADCSRGAGPGSHCLNGAPGTNGSGACRFDTDCGGGAGTCGLDANCFLAPPLPIHVASLGLDVCAANVLLADICGDLDILGFETTVNAALGTRAYLAACPTCVNRKCQGGARNGLSCKAGPTGTSVDCLPAPASFVGTAVAAATLTSEPLVLANSAGNFCPGQPSPGAFGLANARRIRTDGRRPNLLTLQATLAGPFCANASGVGLLDGVVGLPGPAAASMKARVDLLTLLRLFGR